MTEESLLTGRVKLICGDCIEAMAAMEEDSIDAVVCDPPYHLSSIVKRFGKPGSAPAKSNGATGVYARASSGFMGKQWDGGDIAFQPETWAHVLRVLKPGGHLLAFGAPRNFGFMQVAIAEAGFEIRDVICWLFGQGFPKSHDVSKGIDKMLGAEREIIGHQQHPTLRDPTKDDRQDVHQFHAGNPLRDEWKLTAPTTDQAQQWEGWGTALKPGYEPILMCRKPLEGTVAANVLEHGVGGINIDGCRVEHNEECRPMAAQAEVNSIIQQSGRYEPTTELKPNGRWPANVAHDGSEDVVELFPDSKGQLANARSDGAPKTGNVYGKMNHRDGEASADRRYTEAGGTDFAALPGQRRGDSGSAARFFYCAKASAAERIGSKHPTVKPIALLRWLARMVCPPGGVILDPFAGTGTVAEAAACENIRSIMIEREAEYQEDIRRRMQFMMMGPEERERALLKARGKLESPEDLPLFADQAGVAPEAANDNDPTQIGYDPAQNGEAA